MNDASHEAGHSPIAGSADCYGADFRICFSRSDRWQVAMLSERARRWAGQNLNSDLYDVSHTELTTDLEGVNSLLHRARMAGLASEYVGPFESVRL